MDGKEKVLKIFDMQNGEKPHWKIYYGYQQTPSQLAGTTDVLEDNLDSATSRKKLEEYIDLLTPGDYLVQFKDRGKDNNKIVNCRFTIGSEGYHNVARENNGQPMMKGYMTPETHKELLEAERARMKAEYDQKLILKQNQDILKEMRELKASGIGGGLPELVKNAKDIIGMLKGMGNNQPTVITRPAAITGPKMTANDEKQAMMAMYQQAINEIAESEGGGDEGVKKFMELIWCLNEYRKANPQLWNTFKPEIMKMAENMKIEANQEPKT